jgi:dienelactone hydrolase
LTAYCVDGLVLFGRPNPHGFHAGYRASYRKDAAEDGSNRMIAWFKKNQVLS